MNRVLIVLLLAVTSSSCGACRNTTSSPEQQGAGAGAPPAQAPSSIAAPAESVAPHGPGLRRADAASLQLKVPRRFDLVHVNPLYVADALGMDPLRCFEYVRDQIGYEAYPGALRGARGTLMAMAGNSPDRALLLAGLLGYAGHRVRFARGTLSEALAADLVNSMWPERTLTTFVSAGQPSPPPPAMEQTFATAFKRDFTLIRQELQKASVATPASAIARDALVKEAQPHYWIQWEKDGNWIDLDPSFPESAPGRTYTKADEIAATLPPALFHRVEIRVRVEEHTGDKAATREVLKYDATAASLSGADLVLVHQPENWKEPESGPQGAIAAVLEDTGRIKPVLSVGQNHVAGTPFSQRIVTKGLGGVGGLLRGAAQSNPPIATAESVDIDLIAPGGHRETVVREVFDLIGKARRASGAPLSREEIQSRTAAPPDLTRQIYSLFFTTGNVDAGHLSNISDDPARAEGERPDLGEALRRINIAFIAGADGSMNRVAAASGPAILFYPDSPRVQIAEIWVGHQANRLSIDLRRLHARAVSNGASPEQVFFARVARGVAEGTLERLLLEHITSALQDQKTWSPIMSTSSVFDRATIDGVTPVLQPPGTRGSGQIENDAQARLAEEASRGFWTLAPQRPVKVGDAARLAWWRVDPRSGETIGVTDEGLHQAVELHMEHNQAKKETTITYRYYIGNTRVVNLASGDSRTFVTGSQHMGQFLKYILSSGRVRFIETVV